MTTLQTKQIVNLLKEKGVRFENGLSDQEVNQIQEKFRIKFPPDLKLFLQEGLPVNKGFVNWRMGLIDKTTADNIISRINWPLDGMLFDLHNNAFWTYDWGEKPDNYEAQAAVATSHYLNYPKLIPIFSHRYIPSEPNEIGNPIFSVYQMDIICYGYDLASYFAVEFNFTLPSNFEVLTTPKKDIAFWSLVAG